MQKKFYSRLVSAYFISGLLIFSAEILRGQTQYIGPDNGDWATAANWNNGLPSAANPPTIGGGAIVCINGTLPLDFPINNFGTIVNKGTATLTGNLIGGVLDNQANFTVATGAQVNVNAGFTNSGTFINRGAVNINTVVGSNTVSGTINNEGAWDQLSPFTNNGLLDCIAGVFSSPTTITNNQTLEVKTGASYKVDFGGSFINATGSLINNAGNLTNLGSFTNKGVLNNTATYTNNGIHDCFGIFNNESGGQINSTAVMNFTGRLNNKLGATTTSGFRFNVESGGFVSNIGTFNNNNMVDVKLGGTFSNEATGIVNLGFGSSIVNGGHVTTLAGSKITGNGSITNNKKLESYGLIESNNGAAITNTDTLCNFGTIKNVNTITNSKYWKNSGMLDNTSGGVLTNTGNFENFKGATVANNYEVYNRPMGIMTNNGTFANAIRLFNEGLFTNNAYLVTTGDIYNRAGATLTNTEVVEIKEGAIINEGTINNIKLFFNNSCSVISNKSIINNTGRLESWGVVFQRGTVTGTPIVSNSGYVHTGATSNAPTICRDTLETGVDPIGEAKVYGQNPLKAGLGIDECLNFQYFVDNTTRAVYFCSQVGQVLDVPFQLLTRTGDSLTCTIKVKIFDNVPPVITGCPKDVTIITDQNTATHTWTAPTAVDNCVGTPVFATTKASGSSFPLGLTEVIITATDAFNVQAECRFKVEVRKIMATGTCSATDATGPVFGNCPANQTLTTQNGGAIAVWNEPTVTDACLPILLCASANSGQRFPVGTTSVVYTATDSKNNPSTCSFTVTVTGSSGDVCATDNILPVISNCPGNFFTTLNPAINGGVGVWATPGASDNCGAVTLTSNFQTGTIFPAGNTVITYTAKDAKNNTSTCNFTINVAATNPCAGDVTVPTLVCPANIVLNTTSNAATATWTVPTATDNCGTPSVNATHTPNQMFQVGVTTVTYAASDANGNRTTCSFTVTVNNPCFSDTTRPVFLNCPANQTLTTATGSTTATWTAPTATDNCTLAGITSNYASGNTFAVGETPVIYTATDNSGNKENCTFIITVNTATVDPCATDTTAPVLAACPANQTLSTTNSACKVATWTAPIAADNCSTATVISTRASGFCFPVGTTTVTYTAIDANLNTSTCSFTVTVTNIDACATDTIAPVLAACPANLNLTTAATTAIASWTAPTATDNCSTPSVSFVTSPTIGLTNGGAFPIGTTTVTYTAKDALNNTATCSFNVVVAQSTTSSGNVCTNPTANIVGGVGSITITGITTSAALIQVLNGNYTRVYSQQVNTATATVPNLPAGSYLVNLTVLRAGGFWPSVCTQRLRVTVTANTNPNPCANDVTAPVLTACPANQTLTTTNNACKVATWTAPTATDNCGTASVTSTRTSGFCFPVGTTTVRYTAADAKLNTSTCSFTVTVTNANTDPCSTFANSTATEYLVNGVWVIGSSVTVNAGSNLVLSATPNGLASYMWSGPNGFSKWGSSNGDVSVSSAITTAQAGVYTVMLKNANNCTVIKSITVNVNANVTPKSYSASNCNGNGEQLIFKGAIDYLAIGNTMSPKEDRSNCGQNAASSRTLILPKNAVVKAAYLYWSGSGAVDNAVSLNGANVVAQGTKTFYEPTLGISFFAARADVTNLVKNSATFTLSNLTWNNTGNYCQSNSAYGAWSLAVVYEQASLPYSTIHINADKFQYTYPEATYNTYINCVKVPSGVASKAKLTIIAFEGDRYKGENLFIGGVNRGNNNFRGQSGPNLDILTFDVANVVTPATTSLNYYIKSYKTNTIWGSAIEGLFDYVKILKYNTGSSITALANNVNRDVLQIEAATEGHKARIEWINNTGAKNDYFILEKLNPATGDFEKVEIIKNKSAIDENEQYATYHNDPTEGDNTYRVKVVYLDGSTKISDAKTLIFKGIEGINIFPNPASDYVDIDLKKFSGLAVTISVYNQFGKLVQLNQVEKASTAPFHLEFGDVATGSYLIRVQAQGKREVMRKLQIVR
ncbi:MAG: HYR domain-containing protein [Saprospiraceae bacterium]|nr:HYR domain-containing protein [Saprospiraceae bacterium]